MHAADIDYASRYMQKNIPAVLKSDLDKIVLYGSCARNDYNADSDIDVALLTGCDRLAVKKYDDSLMDIVTDIAMDTGAVVHYICIPTAEYNEKLPWYGYFQNIEKDGVVLYG